MPRKSTKKTKKTRKSRKPAKAKKIVKKKDTKKKKKKKRRKDPNAPKRALSAFMFFANENRQRIIQEMGLQPKDIGAIGKALGNAWRDLPKRQRRHYEDKAKADKQRYGVEKEAYERSKPPKIKKPISAYMFFCKETRPMLAKQFPDAPFTELGKKLGAAWKSLGDDDKAPFRIRAENDKLRYQREVDE